MAKKQHQRMVHVGILRQPKTISAASPFQPEGLTNEHWLNSAGVNDAYRTMILEAGSPIPDPGYSAEVLNNTSSVGINEESDRVYVSFEESLKQLPFTAFADLNTLAPLLVGSHFGIVEGGADPFEKIITSLGSSGVIDFRNNEGVLHTLAMFVRLEGDHDYTFNNCILDSLSFTFDFLGDGSARLAKVSGTFFSNQINENISIFPNTWVKLPLVPIGESDNFRFTKFLIGGVDYFDKICLRSMTYTVQNSVVSRCKVKDGEPSQYDITPIYSSNFNFANTEDNQAILHSLYAKNDVIDAVFENDIGTGNLGHLSFVWPNGIIQDNPFEYADDYINFNLNVNWMQIGTTSPVTIILADGLEWGYE